MTRTIVLIPYIYKNICYAHNKDDIPILKIKEQPNGEFICNIDNKCPCDCEGRYKIFKFKNHKICDDWIEYNTSPNKDEDSRWYILLRS